MTADARPLTDASCDDAWAPGGAVVVYPGGTNWFYRAAAADVAAELRGEGMPTALLSAAEFIALPADRTYDCLLVLTLAECLATIPAAEHNALFTRLTTGRRRVLVNYDCVHTHWFRWQFPKPGLFTEIVDISMARQVPEGTRLHGLPYRWIPEALTTAARVELPETRGERPLPWVILGHQTESRVQFAAEAMERFGRTGTLFLPPLRPFRGNGDGSLDGKALARLLGRAQLYLWRSHHDHPFHEGMRAVHAITAGAIPAKIDPRFADRFSHLPWCFTGLDALAGTLSELGHDELWRRCRDTVLAQGHLGQHLAEVLRA